MLIKSVVQAIPTYSMAIFKLPRGLCQHLTSIIRKFWWGSKDGKRKPHWVSWKTMIQPKGMGGLGFKDFELFNLAMLGKQGWRLLTHPQSLCARVLKGKSYPNTDVLHATVPARASATWKAIVAGREALK